MTDQSKTSRTPRGIEGFPFLLPNVSLLVVPSPGTFASAGGLTTARAHVESGRRHGRGVRLGELGAPMTPTGGSGEIHGIDSEDF